MAGLGGVPFDEPFPRDGAGRVLLLFEGNKLQALKYRYRKGQNFAREMKEKFQENFAIIDKSVMDAHRGQSVFTEIGIL